MIIERTSLSPFDLGCTPSPSVTSVLADAGYHLRKTAPWSRKYVGTDVRAYEHACGHRVGLASDGFGLFIHHDRAEVRNLEDHEAIASLLVDRDRHHSQITDGSHAHANVVRQMLSAAKARQSTRRPEIWHPFPYTLSFFLVDRAAANCLGSDDAKRGLSALLEPSQVRPNENRDLHISRQESCGLISELNPSLLQQYVDADLRAGATVLCSWAGFVAFNSGTVAREYYESLEVRLQFAWCRAFFVRRWAELALSRGDQSTDLLSLSTSVRPLLRTSQRIIDAAASTRDQKLFDELVRTSDLEREIRSAEQAVDDVEKLVDRRVSQQQAASNFVLENLLLVLAVLQVLPLIFAAPLVELSPWWIAPIAGAVGIFVFWRHRRLR